MSCKYRHFTREVYLRREKEDDGQTPTILDRDTSQRTEESFQKSCFLCLSDAEFTLHAGRITQVSIHSPVQPQFN